MMPLALEALTQRGRSPFFTDLIALYRDSIAAVVDGGVMSNDGVFDALLTINFMDRMKALVKQHMRITLSNVEIVYSNGPLLQCAQRLSSFAIDDIRSKTQTVGTILTKINDHYDDRKGQYQSDNDSSQSVLFRFIISTAMWQITDKSGQRLFQPEDLAASTLHEFGHIDHTIRASYRVCSYLLDASDIVNYVQHGADTKIALAILSAIAANKRLDPSWQALMTQTLAYFQSNPAPTDGSYREAVTALLALMTADAAQRCLGLFPDIVGSRSDRVYTRLHQIDAERNADEFAARNGAYHYLTGSLAKQAALENDYPKNYLKLNEFDKWVTVKALLVQFTKTFSLAAEDIGNGYDPLIKRMRLIVETAKHAFSDNHLSDAAKVDIRAQITECERYIAEYSSSFHTRKRMEIKRWKDNVAKFGRIVAAPFQDRLSQDYERLQEANRSLTRHPLYYLADSVKR